MTAHAPRLTIASVTGIEVDLRIAGPGSRSYAFTIDWHIRIILALCWYFVGTFAYVHGFSFDAIRSSGAGYSFVVIIPALAIYLLYHPVLEVAMHGRTPGKRIAGLRIVTRTGDDPTPGALLIRNLFRLIDSLPIVYVVGLICVVFTQQHVRIGDLAAGTLLVVDSTDREDALASLSASTGPSFNPARAELAREILDRWPQLSVPARGQLARQLLLRADPTLDAAQLDRATADELRSRLRQLIDGAV
jgi:uncharacterized RDD family membrane protein YckC